MFQKIIAKYPVDGLGFDASGGMHVLQFDGCWVHGHRCWLNRRPGDDAAEKRKQTKKRDDHLKFLSTNPSSPYGPFTYHTIFECQWETMKKANPELRAWADDYVAQWPEKGLSPREALRGGSVCAIKHLIKEIPEDKKANYVDFTS